MTALALIGMAVAFLFIGMPVAIALGLSALATLLLSSDVALARAPAILFESLVDREVLLAIPLFILSAAFLAAGGVATRLLRFAGYLLGHLHGGLAMASVLGCLLFAALSASAPAAAAAVGGAAIGAMLRDGYPERFSAGVSASAATLGILLPPSIALLFYAAATGESAAQLFIAALLPGLLLAALLMLCVNVVARLRGVARRPRAARGELRRAALAALAPVLLIAAVLGVIVAGVADAVDAAAISALCAFLIACCGYRAIGPLKGMPWREAEETLSRAWARNALRTGSALLLCLGDREVRQVILESTKLTVMLLFLFAGAMLFTEVVTSEGIPRALADVVVRWEVPAWLFLAVVNLLLLLAGASLDPSAVILIAAPILLPAAAALQIDPVHLGIILVVNLQVGLVTPPVGLNLFVTSGITGNSLGWVFQAIAPWLGLLLVFLILVTYVPALSLYLPGLVDAPQGLG